VPLDVRNAARISEIALERTPCYGRCPSYTLTLRNDGLVEFTGYEHVSPLGRHVAMIAPRRFTDIAAYDSFYKKLIGKIALTDVSSSFAMGQIKYTTALPLEFVTVSDEDK